MEWHEYSPKRRSRLAGVLAGAVAGVATLAAVVLTFASASGELDAAVARLEPASPASAVAAKVPGRRTRG